MNRLYLFAVAALLLPLSCHTERELAPDYTMGLDPGRITTFQASIEGDPDAKVYADENSKVLWNADDRISVFNKSTYNFQFMFTGEDGDTSGGFDEIEVEGEVSGTPLANIYAVYPYSPETTIDPNEKALNLVLPSQQRYKANSFGVGANTMVAVTNNYFLAFKNVCGYLTFRFYGEDVSVTRIQLRGNNGEKIAGSARVTAGLDAVPTVTMGDSATDAITLVCDPPVQLGSSAVDYTEFWFAVPPTVFTNGFTVTVKDDKGGTYKKSTSKSFTVNRSIKDWMAPLKVEPTVELFAIDMGLPSGVQWGSCNLGSSKPEESGEFFAWGEVQSKANYAWDTYKYLDANQITKYGSIDDTFVLSGADDVALSLLGEGWRIPTKHEFKELLDYCDITWSESPAGYRLTSTVNGNSIFMAADGYMDGQNLITDAPSLARFWSSSTGTYEDEAVFLGLYHSQGKTLATGSAGRHLGMSIRPVFGAVQDIPEAKIEVDRNEVGFGLVLLGQEMREDVTVTNTGDATLEYRIEHPDGVSPGQISPNITIVGNNGNTAAVHALEPGQSESFTVIYTPQGNGDLDQIVFEIKSNAVNGYARLEAFGSGLEMEKELRDVTKPEESGLELVYVQEDGMMVVDAVDAAHAPRVGDYLVSGITEENPNGFLVQVTEVEKQESITTKALLDDTDRWVIKVVTTAISDIFKGPLTIPITVPLEEIEIEEVIDSEGHALEFEKDPHQKRASLSLPLKLDGVTFTPKVDLVPKKLILYLKIESNEIKEFSVESDWKYGVQLKVKVDAKTKLLDAKYHLADIKLKEIKVSVGGVPLVFTPLISFNAGLEVGAGVSLDITPYKASSDIHVGMTYNFDREELSPFEGHTKYFEMGKLENHPSVDLDTKLEIKSHVGIVFNSNFSIGLYYCNYWGRTGKIGTRIKDSKISKHVKDWCAAEVNFDISPRIEAKFSLISFLKNNENSSNYESPDFDFTDKCSMKVQTKPFAKFKCFASTPDLPLLGSKPVSLFEYDDLKSLLIADFTDLQIVTSGDYLQLSANKYMPLFKYLLLPELEYGFTYRNLSEPNSTFIDNNVRPNYLDSYGRDYVSDTVKYNIRGRIPLSMLKEGNLYELYPYTRVKWSDSIFKNAATNWMLDYFHSSSPQYKIYRKGRRFRYTDKGIVMDELENVPGTNL